MLIESIFKLEVLYFTTVTISNSWSIRASSKRSSEIHQKLERWWLLENSFHGWQQAAPIFIRKSGANGSKTFVAARK